MPGVTEGDKDRDRKAIKGTDRQHRDRRVFQYLLYKIDRERETDL